MLYFVSPWLFCDCPSLPPPPFTFLTQLPKPLPSDSRQLVLCIYLSMLLGKAGLLVKNALVFLLSEKVFIFHSSLKVNFSGDSILLGVVFFLSTLQIFHPTLFLQGVRCSAYPCSSADRCFLLWLPSGCFRFLWFASFEYDVSTCIILVFVLLGVPGFLDLWLVSVISCGKFSVIIASNISSVPFSLLVALPLLCYTFCNCLPVFSSPALFFILFFILFFSSRFGLESLYWHFFKLTDYFFSCVYRIDEPIEDILHFCYRIFYF